jgi:phospholipase/carboxylesterase
MNRIAIAPNDLTPSASSTGIKNKHEWLTRARRIADPQTDLPFATFAPIHYEERYAYPLFVWLHGDAGNEQELRQIMPLVSMRNYVAIAPRGSSGADVPVCHGPKWQTGMSAPRAFDWNQTADSIECAENRIAESIAVAHRRFNINPKRIFVAGRDSGGTMAMRVAWNNPSRFAGVAALHGPLPSQLSPLRRVNELRKLPCLLTTSRDSDLYPETRVCDDLRLLHVAGCKVTLRHYPGPDGVTDIMLSDLNNWLMELVCNGGRDS